MINIKIFSPDIVPAVCPCLCCKSSGKLSTHRPYDLATWETLDFPETWRDKQHRSILAYYRQIRKISKNCRQMLRPKERWTTLEEWWSTRALWDEMIQFVNKCFTICRIRRTWTHDISKCDAETDQQWYFPSSFLSIEFRGVRHDRSMRTAYTDIR